MPLRAAEQRYQNLRLRARKECEEEIYDGLDSIGLGCSDVDIKVTGIDAQALRAWKADWPNAPLAHRGGWNWEEKLSKIKNAPKRLDLAIWGESDLCGLCLGGVNSSGNILNLYLLEGKPVPDHPLKRRIRHIAVDAALRYGDLIEVAELRLRDPLEAVVDLYRAMGFDTGGLSENPPYCSMRLR